MPLPKIKNKAKEGINKHIEVSEEVTENISTRENDIQKGQRSGYACEPTGSDGFDVYMNYMNMNGPIGF